MFGDGQITNKLFRISFLALIGAALFLASCSQKQVAQEEPNFEPTPGKTYKVAEVDEPQTPVTDVDLNSTYFDTDRATLKPHAKAVLKKHAEWMKKHPNALVQIEGVCDERGTYEHNIQLGDRRALSAKRFLISQGIKASRIETLSRGAMPGSEPRKMAKNRRAAFIVYYSGE